MSSFIKNSETNLWSCKTDNYIGQKVALCLNAGLGHQESIDKINNDPKLKKLYEMYLGETDPNVLLDLFERDCDNEHDYFFNNVDNIDIVKKQINECIWCEPTLYSICWQKPVIEATRDHWMQNPETFKETMSECWNGSCEDLEGIVYLNEVFGNDYCKIIWKDDFDYSKVPIAIIAKMIDLTVDKISLIKSFPKIIKRTSYPEAEILCDLISKHLVKLIE